jgi:hypothetical protein
MTQFTSGTFYDAQTANKAVNAIIAMDYPRDRINVILSEQTRRRFWDAALREKPTITDTKTGGASDDTIGTLFASGAGGPGKGPTAGSDNDAETVIVVGPAAAALAPGGTDVRGSSRALDVLTHLGLPRGDAERLDREIKSGGIVVGVSTSNADRDGVERTLRNNAAQNVMETMMTR